MIYESYIAEKLRPVEVAGISNPSPRPFLYDFQEAIYRWAVERGRAAIFADCGLGKTPMQLAWIDEIVRRTGRPGLIIAPLAVSAQTRREGEKFGIACHVARAQDQCGDGISICNYEMLSHFDPCQFGAVVLDESSILKAYTGSVRRDIQTFCEAIPYRLACTATPSPNDIIEIGTHAEFMGEMNQGDMLSRFFVHDASRSNAWRIKGHAEEPFYSWLATWAVALRNPSDLGYDGAAFCLPPLRVVHHEIESGPLDGEMFARPVQTLDEQRQARKQTVSERVDKCAEIANAADGQVLVWVNYNDESDMIRRAVLGSVEIKGSDTTDHKESAMLGFSSGDVRALVTKPTIAGFGMNWQNCNTMIMTGLSHSYEQYYQAIRRCWRFGQQRPVTVHLVYSQAEGEIVANVQRKEMEASRMFDRLIDHMRGRMIGQSVPRGVYSAREPMALPGWF